MNDSWIAENTLIVACRGWNDAGEAASRVAEELLNDAEYDEVNTFDGNAFYDFQLTRPLIGRNERGQREIAWPRLTLYAPVGHDRPFLLLGSEPNFNWAGLSERIVEFVMAQGITHVLLIGALLAEVPHTRPIPVHCSTENREVRARFGFERSNYEGPTGILGVLSVAIEDAGCTAISLWASVPHYVHHSPCPPATVALLEKIRSLIAVDSNSDALERDVQEFLSHIASLTGDDEDMSAYVSSLENVADEAAEVESGGETLAAEFEQFLRNRDSES